MLETSGNTSRKMGSDKIPETGPDNMTLDIECPNCKQAQLVLLPACCKYERLGWEVVKKCPLQCGYVERVL